MESRKFSLVLFSVITFVAALFEISSGNEDLARKKFDSKEMIVLANQVRDIISVLYCSVNLSICIGIKLFLGNKYPPIFSYSKQKNGNYSFGGLAYEIMQIAQDYLNIR